MHFHTEEIVPFIAWLRRYNRHHFKADLFAGLTVAVVALPQSMAYAYIAGLPVRYGLYASIVPTIIGCLWCRLRRGGKTELPLPAQSRVEDLGSRRSRIVRQPAICADWAIQEGFPGHVRGILADLHRRIPGKQ